MSCFASLPSWPDLSLHFSRHNCQKTRSNDLPFFLRHYLVPLLALSKVWYSLFHTIQFNFTLSFPLTLIHPFPLFFIPIPSPYHLYTFFTLIWVPWTKLYPVILSTVTDTITHASLYHHNPLTLIHTRRNLPLSVLLPSLFQHKSLNPSPSIILA